MIAAPKNHQRYQTINDINGMPLSEDYLLWIVDNQEPEGRLK